MSREPAHKEEEFEEEEREYETEEEEEEEEEYIGDTDDSDVSENEDAKKIGIDTDFLGELDDTIELSDEEEDEPRKGKDRSVVRESEPFDERLFAEYLKRKPNETLYRFRARNMIALKIKDTKIRFGDIPVVVECILNQCCGAQYSIVLTDYINSLK